MIFQTIAKILGSDKAIAKGIDLVDSMHTSDEESIKAATHQKVEIMKAYAPFKIAQRWLALMFGLTFLGSYALVLTMTLTGKGDASAITQVMEQFSIDYAMLLILGFYFGGGLVESVGSVRNKQ